MSWNEDEAITTIIYKNAGAGNWATTWPWVVRNTGTRCRSVPRNNTSQRNRTFTSNPVTIHFLGSLDTPGQGYVTQSADDARLPMTHVHTHARKHFLASGAATGHSWCPTWLKLVTLRSTIANKMGKPYRWVNSHTRHNHILLSYLERGSGLLKRNLRVNLVRKSCITCL